MSHDRIIARIRKLMNLANDGGASDGEIENAMRFAAELMDAHHISEDDVNGSDPAEPQAVEMGRRTAASTTSRLATWEVSLINAIQVLIGTVRSYRAGATETIKIDGIAQTDKRGRVKRGVAVTFYGPDEDSVEAARLFSEWARLIATMGVAKYGGCYRGDGAQYCHGFARALLRAAQKATRGRIEQKAKPLRIGQQTTTALTVATRHDLIKRQAETWLQVQLGYKLQSGGSRSGYGGSRSAYSEGQRDGNAAGFGRGQRNAGRLT